MSIFSDLLKVRQDSQPDWSPTDLDKVADFIELRDGPGRPRVYQSNADRQRAYRERRKAEP